jgi:hydroxyacylglutathione hydrolase
MKVNILKNLEKSVNLSNLSTIKNYQKLYSIIFKSKSCNIFSKNNKTPLFYKNGCHSLFTPLTKFNLSNTCKTKTTETCPSSHLPTFEEIFQNTKDYYVEQISTGCLAQYAYYIESNGEAAIVDPMRETDVYLEILKKRGAKLKYILETHFHADFVSGHLELSKLTGAKIIFGPSANSNLPVLVAKDGELLPLGNINVKVFHTPGHTLESSSFVLLNSEKKPKAMFTGDFLFLGEVGRPDLAVGGNITKENLGELIYESVQRLKKEYPEDVVIFPGHGAGSACGKNISKGTCDTLKNQIKTNYALNDKLSKEEFVKIVTSNLPTPPQYFFHDAMLNKMGADSVQEALQEVHKGIKPENFAKIIKSDNNVKIIDTRDINKSRQFFLRGSYLVALNMNYAIFVATLCKPDDKILLIADPGQERESIIRLFRVGYDKILGFLDGNVESLKGLVESDLLVSIDSTKPEEVKQILEKNSQEKLFEILDVREPSEWESTGILPNAHLYSLSNVEKNIEQIKKECQGKKIGIMCKTGGRATIAASIFKKHEINDVFVLGGYLNLKEKDVNFVNYKKN